MGRTNVMNGTYFLNVYAQSSEPVKKEGIWINTSATGSLPAINKFEPNRVKVISAQQTRENSYFKFTDFSGYGEGIASAKIGTDIFIFGGAQFSNTARKYDTLNDNFTTLSNIPAKALYAQAVAIGTDIYLFGLKTSDLSNTNLVYKYDVSTNSYTQLADLPYNFSYGSIAAVGNDIYIFFSNQYLYKYNVLNDSYTRLNDIPYQFQAGMAVAVDSDIYFGGGENNGTYYSSWYKYDTINGNYTQLTNLPYQCAHGSIVAIDNDIFLFGGGTNSSNRTNAYKYNILNDTYTALLDIPQNLYSSTAEVVGNYVFLFGIKYIYVTKVSYNANSLYLVQNANAYQINLTKTLELEVQIAYITDSNAEVLEYPCYYGNGTSWNLIGN